jgi:hypothetical protein
MPASVEIFGSSIVVLGSFNPAIFTPDWLERYELIGKEDADKARQGEIVVTRPLARFETDWFALQAKEDQLSITSNGALSPGLKDLSVGALALLPHTPIRAVGVNFFAHYKLTSIDEYHKIGDVLAPKEIWHRLFPSDKQASGLGNLTITVEPAKRGEKPSTRDKKNITIQPSSKVISGIYFVFNDHHQPAPEGQSVTSVAWCTNIIEESWQSTWEEAKRVFDEVLDYAIKT